MAPPYIETVQLIDFVEEDIDAVLLRNPKWDTDFAVDSYVNVSNTKYKSYDRASGVKSTPLSDEQKK